MIVSTSPCLAAKWSSLCISSQNTVLPLQNLCSYALGEPRVHGRVPVAAAEGAGDAAEETGRVRGEGAAGVGAPRDAEAQRRHREQQKSLGKQQVQFWRGKGLQYHSVTHLSYYNFIILFPLFSYAFILGNPSGCATGLN